jgi:hypothetical protein
MSHQPEQAAPSLIPVRYTLGDREYVHLLRPIDSNVVAEFNRREALYENRPARRKR